MGSGPFVSARQGFLSPFHLAQLYREEFPGKFDDIEDTDLIRAIEVEDPESYQLIDPLLIGAEVVSPSVRKRPAPTPAPTMVPLPPQLSTGDIVATTGLRVVPAIGGSIAGGVLTKTPAGIAYGGALGAGVGETLAQAYEKAFGPRESISIPVVAAEAGLGALNPAARGASLLRRVGQQALVGGGLAGASQVARAGYEEGRLPTREELALTIPAGMAFGAGAHGAFEGVSALARRAPSMGDLTGALPPPSPVPMSPADQLVVARAAAAQYQAEEARLAKGLIDTFGDKAIQGRTGGDFHTAIQAKDYLDQLAQLQGTPTPIPPMPGGIRGATPMETRIFAPGGQRQIPERVTVDRLVYPPEAPIEVVGATQPSRIVGGRDVGGVTAEAAPPPTTELDRATAALPEPPTLGPELTLTAPPSLVRGRARPTQPSLLEAPRAPQGLIRPGAELGGAPPTLAQPRLRAGGEPQPGYQITTPRPIDRVYATGPNAGPRREGETHAQPRMLRRQVQVGTETTYENYPSRRTAEDPATFDPEVRRELARMVWELETFRYERVKGGVTRQQLAEMVRSGVAKDISEATRIVRQSKASAGGAIPGAPVYHEIKGAAEGAFQHATREQQLQAIRTALLQGKGSALTDAAAEVARSRIAQEAMGIEKGPHNILAPPGAGDELIGWVDPITGEQALPGQQLDEWTRAAREADDGELLAAIRTEQAGPVADETLPFFEAARVEAARRGLITPEQLALTMEGPGGAKGPSLFEFEGEPSPLSSLEARRQRAAQAGQGQEDVPPPPPPPPGQAERNAVLRAQLATEGKGGAIPPELRTPARRLPHELLPGVEPEGAVPLPGLEPVRGEERALPPVAEAPPPSAPSIAPERPGVQPSLFEGERRPLLRHLFYDETGALYLHADPIPPAGDRPGLRKWLRRQEADHGGEAWFSRVEQAMADGDWDRAWKAAASAYVRSYNKAYAAAKTPQEERALEQSVRGTVLQQDLPAQIVAVGRAQQQKRPAPTVSDLPPSYRLTVRQGGQGMTLGPAGLIQPGAPTLKPKGPTRAVTLDRAVMDSFVEAIGETPELVHLVRGNRDAALRLGRQVTDLVVQGQVDFDPGAFPGMTREEVGRQYMHTLSEAGRILGAHGRYVQEFGDELYEMADRMDMGAALAGTLRGGRRPIVGARGRPLSAGAARALDEVAQQSRTPQVAQNLLLNDLARPPKRSTGELLMDSQYAFLTSGFATALRNTYTTVARYGWDLLDQAIQIPVATILGERTAGRMAGAMLRERVGARHTGFAVTPRRAMTADTFEAIYDLNAATLSEMRPTDARRTLQILSEYPDEAAHLIGWAGGEQLAEQGPDTGSTILSKILSPKVQRFLTLWNRSQEFTGRALTFDTHFRAQLRTRGLDPVQVLADPSREALAAQLGGDRAVEEMLRYASNAALEMTWAGQLANRSIPGALVKVVQDHWPAKLVQRFPRFNFSAAPRWIYDHSPAALLDLVRLPFDRIGWTSTGKNLGGGRLYRGLKSQEYQTDVIPALRGKITEAEGRLGDTVLELQGTHREWTVRQRQVTRLAARAQQGLPGVQDALAQATAARDQLALRRDRLQGQITGHRQTIQDLKAKEGDLWKEVQNATGISAPTYSSWMARMTSGTFGLLGAAIVMRSQPEAEGTRFFQYRIDREGQDPYMLDLRSAAPFVQYLAVADVLVDFWRYTDWPALQQEMAEGGDSTNPLAWQRAFWSHYEGKYTAQLLGSEFAQAFLSISRAAGTSLTIADLMTRNGWPGPGEAADALIGTIGQFLAGYATPLGQFKDILGQLSEEEAQVRGTPRPSLQDPASWSYPLAEGLARVPLASRLIPPVYSQTTGQPLRSVNPAARALTGIGGSPADFIQEETRRIGLPGSTVYFRETGDYGLDTLLAQTYARILNTELPGVLESDEYQALGTPAAQRDYLQRVFPSFKRAALAETKELLGLERVEAATVQGEEVRRKRRREALLQRLEEGQPALETAPIEEPTTPPPAPF
jgi:hypothetical protein